MPVSGGGEGVSLGLLRRLPNAREQGAGTNLGVKGLHLPGHCKRHQSNRLLLRPEHWRALRQRNGRRRQPFGLADPRRLHLRGQGRDDGGGARFGPIRWESRIWDRTN